MAPRHVYCPVDGCEYSEGNPLAHECEDFDTFSPHLGSHASREMQTRIRFLDDQSATLLWAARKGHKAVVELLLDKGADTESRDNYSHTPLSWAAQAGHEAVVELLLDKGAHIESRGSDGETPLSRAAKLGHKAVLELLLDKGADIESRNEGGMTPTEWAEYMGKTDLAEMLRQERARRNMI